MAAPRTLLAVLLLCVALAEQASVSVQSPATAPASASAPLHRVFLNHNRRQLRRLKEPPPRLQGHLKDGKIVEAYFDQVLDHFNPTDNRTWRQVSGGQRAADTSSPLNWMDWQ